MRVLIIEDNERLSLLLAEGLARRGFSCDAAGSLAEADDFLAVTGYDALVLDLGLPDGDGPHFIAFRKGKDEAGPPGETGPAMPAPA